MEKYFWKKFNFNDIWKPKNSVTVKYREIARGKNFLFLEILQNILAFFSIFFTPIYTNLVWSKAFKYPDTRSPYNTENIIEKPDIRYFKHLW